MRINKYRLSSNLIMGGIYLSIFGLIAMFNSKLGIPVWQTALIYGGTLLAMLGLGKLISYAAHLSVMADMADEQDEKPCLGEVLVDALTMARNTGSSAIEISIGKDGIETKVLSEAETKELEKTVKKQRAKKSK